MNALVERLDHLAKQRASLSQLRDKVVRLQAIARSSRWLDRVRPIALRLAGQGQSRVDALETVLEEFSHELAAWAAALETKQIDWAQWKDKHASRVQPLVVSRARKLPEIRFLSEQQANEIRLREKFVGLRDRITGFYGRFDRLWDAVDRHCASSPALFEQARKQVLDTMIAPAQRLLALQERASDEGIRLEGACRTLTQLGDDIRLLRCLEDVYRASPPWWKAVKYAIESWRNRREKPPTGPPGSEGATASET